MTSRLQRIALAAGIILVLALVFGMTWAYARGALRSRLNSAAIGTAFTYQGRLDVAGAPANGAYDFQFGLHDAPALGSQVGVTLTQMLSVSSGIFSTQLDFGSGAFTGQPRYLAIRVKPSAGGDYFALKPRQALTGSPYAIFADSSDWTGILNIPADIADGDDIGPDPANVIWVAKSGGDFTSIGAALASISDSGANNPYLVRIAPGIYTETVDLKNYVDLEGSGEGVTILRATGSGTSPLTDGTSATLRAGNVVAEVRQLTVESNGTGQFATAIRTEGAGSGLVFYHVTASASGAASHNFGNYNENSQAVFRFVQFSASGGQTSYGVYNAGASSTLFIHVTASGLSATFTYGAYNTDSTPTFQDSTLVGTTNSLFNSGSNPKIIFSKLDGAMGGSASTCFQSYDGSLAGVSCAYP